MSLKKQAINGISWTLLQLIGFAIISFLVENLVARYIAPSDLGMYSLMAVFIALGNSLSDSGMGQSIIRANDLEDDDYGTIFLTNLGISTFLYLVIVLASPTIANFYDKPYLKLPLIVLSLTVILTSFSSIHKNRLTRKMDFKTQTIIQLPSLIISGLLGVILAFKGYGVWSLVFMTLTRNFLLSVQYWFLSGWRPKFIFSKEKFKKHFDFGYKLTISGLISTLVTYLIHMIIGKYYSTAQLGFYTKGGDMNGYVKNSITGVLNKVTFPLFSKVKNNKVRLLKAYKKIQNVVLFVMCPIMLCLILVSEPLFELFLGEKWIPATFFFNIFCITGIFYPIHIYNLNVLKVSGKSDRYLHASLLKKANLLIITLTTCWISIEAIMYGLAIHSFISLFINMYFGSKEIGYTIPQQLVDFIKILFPGFIVFGLLYLIKINTDLLVLENNIGQILLVSIIYSVIYVSVNVIFKTRSLSDFLDLLTGVPKLDKFAKKIHSKIY